VLTHWRVVLDDGTRPFGPGILTDQRRPLHLVVSEDATLQISITDPVGGEITLTSGEFLVLVGRTAARPIRQLFAVRSTPSGRDNRIVFSGSMTKALAPQRGTFDLWAIRAAGRSCLVPLSALELAPSALGNNYL
jgi:hypothetical protein